MRHLHLLAATALLTSCGSDLPKGQLVVNLRIVGVQAEPPQASPGTTVQLAALVMQPDLAAGIERQWAACVIAPGASPAACLGPTPGAIPPDCADAPEATFCLLGTGETASYQVPQVALQGRAPGDSGQVVITLIAAASADGGVLACAVALMDPESAPESCRVAVKRLTVLPAGVDSDNANPVVTSLAADGDVLSATLDTAAVETTPDGPEALYLSWYVTGGELEKFRTDAATDDLANTWTLPTEPGDYQAAVVVHDGRGGESWLTTTITVP
jgi:hypothetical protein